MLINLRVKDGVSNEVLGLFAVVVGITETKKRKKIYKKKTPIKIMYAVWPTYEKGQDGDIMAISLECKESVKKGDVDWLPNIQWAIVDDVGKPLKYDSRWPTGQDFGELDKEIIEDLNMLVGDTFYDYWYDNNFEYYDKKAESERQERQRILKTKFQKVIEDNRSKCMDVKNAYYDRYHKTASKEASKRGWELDSVVVEDQRYSAYGHLLDIEW